jgi:cellulose biosynthesis protein BcsQ
MMTRIFVFTNHKGGVGKSTSATNVAFGLAGLLNHQGAPNPRVLLIDTDSQAHATLVTTGRKDFGSDDSLYTVLMADRTAAAQTMLNCITASTWDTNSTRLAHVGSRRARVDECAGSALPLDRPVVAHC